MTKLFLITFLSGSVASACAQSWMPVASGLTADLTSVRFTSANRGYACGPAAKLFVTTTGGTTWAQLPVPSPLSVSFRGIEAMPNGANDLLLVSGNDNNANGTNATLLRSVNSGLNWTLQNIQHSSGFEYAIHCEDVNTCFLSGGETGMGGMIARTTSGGPSWTKSNMADVAFFNDITFPTAMVGYAVGLEGTPFQNGTIYKTTNGGANWAPLTELPGGQLRAIHCFDATTCICVGGSMAHRTTNGGANWTSSTVEAGATLRDIGFINATNGYIISGDDVYKTTNGGTSWAADPGYTGTATLSGLHLLPNAGVGYIVGQAGAVYKLSFAPVGVQENQAIAGVEVFPNPATDVLSIRTTSLPREIAITDITGRTLRTIAPRTELVILDIADLPSGIYFARVALPTSTTVVRWLKQ